MSLGKSFRPQKTRKARKYLGIYQTVDCMDAGGRAMHGAIAEDCHPKDELLNQHTHTDLFRVFRVFRGSIGVLG